MARGVDDVVVAVVASPQSTVIGGATETVRDLVAAWEQRDVMAREVAVDVASHSPQVDPILDELAEVLADLDPMAPEVPVLLGDPVRPARAARAAMPGTGSDNLRHTVRFAAAVQAALEDGYRVFAELAPHPLLTHAVEQTAASLDMPVAALAAMRREQPLPHGLRGLLADLHSAGAAVDFSVLYPGGRLVDAPLPAWTPPSAAADAAAARIAGTRRSTVAGAPAAGRACAAARGAGAPRLAGRGRHRGAALAGRPPGPQRGRASGGRLLRDGVGRGPHASSARRPRSATSASSRCCCWTTRPRSSAAASVTSPGVVDFAVETHPGRRARCGGPRRCCTPADG